MRFHPQLLHFWAKLGSETWPDKYHPVIYHLIDVAQVAGLLWDRVFRLKIRSWISKQLGLKGDDARKWLAFCAGAHDIGKIAPCFQHRDKRTEQLKQMLERDSFSFAMTLDKPHGQISTAALAHELAQNGPWPKLDSGFAKRVAIAVGGHHGIFPTDWDSILDDGTAGNEPWGIARKAILAELARLLELDSIPPVKPPNETDQSALMYLAGLTSVADWIGSNKQFFKPAIGDESDCDPNDIDCYFAHSARKAEQALRELGWLERADPGPPITFRELFPKIENPRPLQVAIEEIAKGMQEPSLIIVEAPMGEGKTEAAWYVAECWDRQGGQGTYVALPTMATSNQMFDRVGVFLEGGVEGKKNLMLQHGKAALNKKFEDLKHEAEVYDDEKQPSAVVAEGWFAANKKHNLLAPYGVGTIDQALLAVLQTKHVFVRLFGLAGKCVILDEVHAYDAYMTTLMERLLQWLSAIGCPVVLLSATLPKEKRRQLLKAYTPEHTEQAEAPYPRITGAGSSALLPTPIEADSSRSRTIQLNWIDDGQLASRLEAALADGGCAAVIRNTVGTAQETFLRLREPLKHAGIEVELFHARFPFGRRQQIEDEVLERFGKAGSPEGRRKRVLVATQVIEQSLDLDFDLMISDHAPADLVYQRTGRLRRHNRKRPGCFGESPQLWLIQPKTKENGLPDFGVSECVYARVILLRSYLALQERPTIQQPADLEKTIEQVYGSESLSIPDSSWAAELKRTQEEFREGIRKQRLNARGVTVYEPTDEDLLSQWSLCLEEDNPEAHRKLQAATRDTEPTVQIVIVYRWNGNDYLDVGGTVPFNEKEKPTLARTRAILQNEATVSHRGFVAFYSKIKCPTGWRDTGLLRYHRLVRVDNNGDSTEGYALNLNNDLGIRFTANERDD